MTELTLGSLFDGSGGFPLAGKNVGIKPIWSSEVEPFPIAVTRKNLPEVKHLGSITEVNGGEIPPVDIITFGSPCQDLSMAGKRAGLGGTKSNLFHQACRIIKEMRKKTNGKYPRWIVWENVVGAFSSQQGEDFRCVLEEISKIKNENVSIPKPRKKWTTSGELLAGEYSIAWRVLDAQYFGVPQRRRRIFLVADFTGNGAREILFNEETMSRNFRKNREIRENISRELDESIKSTDGETIDTELYENHAAGCRYTGPHKVSPTITSTFGTGGNNQHFVVNKKECYDVRLTSKGSKTVRNNIYKTETHRTLDTAVPDPGRNQGGVAIVNSYFISNASPKFMSYGENVTSTLLASDYKRTPYVTEENYTIRKITPLECCRLQGFPDYWCDDLGIENPTEEDLVFWRKVFETQRLINGGVKAKTDNQIKRWLSNPYSESGAYKMWGNGVALPCVMFVLDGIFNFNKKESK